MATVLSLLAGLLVAAGSVAAAAPAAAAPGGPWTNPDGSACVGQAFVIAEAGAPNNVRSIQRIDVVTGDVLETVPLANGFNSLAFNDDDGYLYGTYRPGLGGSPAPNGVTAGGAFWRIGAGGAVEQIQVQGPDMVAPSPANGGMGSLPEASYPIGTFDENGIYWVASKEYVPAPNSTMMYGFEIVPGATPGTVIMRQFGAPIAISPAVDISDFSSIPGTNQIWGVTDSQGAGAESHLVSIDVGTGVTTDYGVVNGLPRAQFIGAFVDAAGNLYALQSGATGAIWAINRSQAVNEDGTSTGVPLVSRQISAVGTLGNGDAAQCGLLEIPQLLFSKVVDRSEAEIGDTLTYTVNVENTSFFDLTDIPVTDALPAGAEFVSASNGGVHSNGEVTWNIDLAAGESLDLTIEVIARAGDANGELLNRVLVDNPPGTPGDIPPPWPTPETVCEDDPTRACAVTEVPEPVLEVTKTSDATADSRVGDVVTYTVTATNTGETPFTVANPAVVFDDLSGVLDDAAYNDDAEADQTGTLGFAEPLLSWEGALGAGDSVEITYSVTLQAGGDGTVRNVAWIPEDPENPETPACDPPASGTDPTTGEPCAEVEYLLPKLTITKTADRTELPAVGETVEYTVVVTNIGPGAYTAAAPATATDDLSEVLDAADYNDDAAASVGSVAYSEPNLSWSGVLAAGASATITYSVTYTGEGDQRLRNLACIPEEDAAPGTEPCDIVEIPGADLVQWKQVEASATPVVEGTVLTYTLFFRNDGGAAADVDAVDDLTHVTDDAVVSTEPTSADGLRAVRTGDRIAITGSVPAGETFTVTYQVTVKADDERGDNIAANFLLSPEETPPTDPECDPSDPALPDCTVTPIPELIDTKSVDPASGTPVVAGQELTYTLTFTNIGEATGTVAKVDDLTHVTDDATIVAEPVASDPTLVVTRSGNRISIAGELAAGETVTVSYTVRINPTGQRGDDVLANFLIAPDEQPPTDPICVPGEGQQPDCTTNPVGDISPSKTVNPASGTTVAAGQVLTYTLAFENTGRGAASVNYTDHLAGVLDDAEWVDSLSASDELTVVGPTNQTLVITGTVAPGETATVTYQVRVHAYPAQGDHLLENFVTQTGEVPPTECVVDNPLCTENPTQPPAPGTPPLAMTGGQISIAVVLIALLLVGLGGGLLIVSRKRKRQTAGEASADEDRSSIDLL